VAVRHVDDEGDGVDPRIIGVTFRTSRGAARGIGLRHFSDAIAVVSIRTFEDAVNGHRAAIADGVLERRLSHCLQLRPLHLSGREIRTPRAAG
jgi:hypothetical protein